ncbi:39S ribosomal protein L16 [Schistosoma japonicum]|uniref:Large ribosomal subunit protein uL16m n=1 Tax=Schistosoma japonicum TaxID=6182 RepID=A0A4Z2D9P9_SCHJA|nr:39S ribosomal protein L16 [Schistosoma japonicum]
MLGNCLRTFLGREHAIWANSRNLRNAHTHLPYSEYHPDIYLQVTGELSDLEFPPDRRRLHPVNKQPQLPGSTKPPKYTRRKIDCRGPETVFNKLIYSQYGIQATEGGELEFGHFEMMRVAINKHLDEKRMFALWCVDAPWKPVTRRAQGKRKGGGKANIHHYTTPVKAERIIVELGGYLNWREAYRILSRVADKLPFRARFISQDLLNTESQIEAYIKEKNVNPFYQPGYALAHNYAGCRSFISPYYLDWGTPGNHDSRRAAYDSRSEKNVRLQIFTHRKLI